MLYFKLSQTFEVDLLIIRNCLCLIDCAEGLYELKHQDKVILLSGRR